MDQSRQKRKLKSRKREKWNGKYCQNSFPTYLNVSFDMRPTARSYSNATMINVAGQGSFTVQLSTLKCAVDGKKASYRPGFFLNLAHRVLSRGVKICSWNEKQKS